MSSSATLPRERANSAPSALGLIALIISAGGFVLCALMAFGLLAMPVLQPLHMYTYIGLHDIDLLALVIGTVGPLPAAIGTGLGWWARRAGTKRREPTVLATVAVALGFAGLVLVGLGLAINEFAARGGHLF